MKIKTYIIFFLVVVLMTAALVYWQVRGNVSYQNGLVLNIATTSETALGVVISSSTPATNNAPTYITVGNSTLKVGIADTAALQQQGLSDTPSLAQGTGLLFVFGSDGQWGFWMKEMNYSLDIIWISASDKIVYVENDLAPSTYPETFTPSTDARYVLEANAGFFAKSGAKIGDTVSIFKK